MERVWQELEEHLKEYIIPSLMTLFQTMFGYVNDEVSGIASDVAMTPSAFSPSVFGMVRNVSENVIMPIAGIILTFVACYELIQLIISYNNLANFETWFIFKWIFKTAIAVEIITHTFDFAMAVFAVANHVGGLHGGHYFAYGKNFIDGGWYEFNDSNVSSIEEKKVVSDNAYVLFYNKRREENINEEELFKKPFIEIDYSKYI